MINITTEFRNFNAPLLNHKPLNQQIVQGQNFQSLVSSEFRYNVYCNSLNKYLQNKGNLIRHYLKITPNIYFTGV